MKIYFAAPLHGSFEQGLNNTIVGLLRKNGHQVYLPQEHGIWEDMVRTEARAHPDEVSESIINRVKNELYRGDLQAVQTCDCIVADGTHEDGSPSEGMVWEMGYAVGLGKPVYLCNTGNEWDYNLMLTYGATKVFDNMTDCIEYLSQQAYV